MDKYELIENAAVVCNITYVVLVSYKNIWCWLFGILGSGLSVLLFLESGLYSESILMGFYVIAGVYGWLTWGETKDKNHPIVKWELNKHLWFIALSIVGSMVLFGVMSQIPGAKKPLIDAFTTAFSIGTTYLVAKMVLSNWVYWIIINAVTIYLYFSRDLNIYAYQMIAFLGMSIFGYIKWQRAYQLQSVQ